MLIKVGGRLEIINKIILVGQLFCIVFSSSAIIDRKLKILIVVNKFPYAPRQYLNNQITGLLDKGHDVYILAKECPDFHNDYPAVQTYNLLKRTFYNILPNNMQKFDILFCQFGGSGKYCLKKMEETDLQGKLVVCFRGGDASTELIKNPKKYDELFEKADLILPVCENFKNRLIKHGCSPKKITVHHSGINCREFTYKPRKMPKNSSIKIITVARLTEMKGFIYAIKAISKLRKKYPKILYQIIGDGEQKNDLIKLVNKLKLENNVKFLGYLQHSEVINKLKSAHIALLSSITTSLGEQEGIPNALMEAMATGLPVVATQHSGIRELVKEKNSGLLAPEKNSKALMKLLLYLIKNNKIWKKMGRNGRNHVLQEHNSEIQNKRLITLFYSLVDKS